MTTRRLSPTEVQVDDVICVFKNATDADDFESCVATVDLKYCELEVPPIDKRYAEPGSQNSADSL
jgi:hypothetical protein